MNNTKLKLHHQLETEVYRDDNKDICIKQIDLTGKESIIIINDRNLGKLQNLLRKIKWRF